jgi:hypothetical protein
VDNSPSLDLARERGLAEVLATTLDLFTDRFALFLSVTLVVVAPTILLVDGIWGNGLVDGAHSGHLSGGSAVAGSFLTAVVVPPLVTALHAVIVRDLGTSSIPSVGGALREAAPRFPAAIGAILLYSCGTAIGLIFLVIPGIWLAVRWYFAAQATVIDGVTPLQSLAVSSQLIEGRWWRTFGALILTGVIFGGTSDLLRALIGAVHNGAVYMTLDITIQAAFISLTALFGTLLFFSWRASTTHPRPLSADG